MKTLLAYLLRVCIALDEFVQSFFHYGVPGITISSRIGMANEDGHRWGVVCFWILDHTWPFGKDPVTGESHCNSAIKHDRERAHAVLKELERYCHD